MAIASDRVSAEIVDWEEFRKLGRRHRVTAVPKTFFNYGDPVTGAAPEPSILEKVLQAP